MKRKWTKEQADAIEARGGSLLVSAAAGSGKTSVLVERVIERLADKENVCPPQALLIVTFTRAAASQMKTRIASALSKKITENPNDKHLRAQQMKLPFAQICTIDSFCGSLIRENFHLLSISPDFKILDEGELSIMRAEAAAGAIEEIYKTGGEKAFTLSELLSPGKDDGRFAESIVSIYNRSQAYPFPEEWLNSLCLPYEDGSSAKESRWGREILNYLTGLLDYALDSYNGCLEYVAGDEMAEERFGYIYPFDTSVLNELKKKIEEGSWNEILFAVENLEFEKYKKKKRGEFSEKDQFAYNFRNSMKKLVFETAKKYVCVNEQDNAEDIKNLKGCAETLVEAVKLFGRRFSELKEQSDGMDFSDIVHSALSLLVSSVPGGYEKTPLALELSEKYEEILVDEYQDINEAQDMMFKALSKNESNLFMVGDVKQSIYGFRQAMPKIFIERREKMYPYAEKKYPAKVLLSKNFRSREGITDNINFVFSQLMSRSAGDVDYDETEQLVAGAVFSEGTGADVELHLLEAEPPEGEDADTLQAAYCAKLISEMVASKARVTEGGKTRPVRYGDFCILLRSAGKKGPAYARKLAACGIPAHAQETGGFFETAEIRLMLSLLRVLDNPVSDVPLLSVMLSPLFGFTPDDAARLRIAQRDLPIYNCITEAAGLGDEKCKLFLKKTQEMRRLGSTMACGEFIRRLLVQTGIYAIAGSMNAGAARQANLMLLTQYADKYQSSGKTGLSGFIRYIDKLASLNRDLDRANELSEASDAVRIMTIHKSKGLEFPICIVSGCSSKFNMRDYSGGMITDDELGVSFKSRDDKTGGTFETLGTCASKIKGTGENYSEELRVWYVAFTRAKEKLITISHTKNAKSLMEKLASDILPNKNISPFSVRRAANPSEWILKAALRHPDAHNLRGLAGAPGEIVLPVPFSLKTVVTGAAEPEEITEPPQKEAAKANEELVRELRERLNYEYPYLSLKGVIAKSGASDFAENEHEMEYFASARPAFMEENGLTPAQRGTALHKFMQFADYELAAKNPAAERDRLAAKRFLSEKEAESLELKKIAAFFGGGLAKRIFASEEIMREKKFAVKIPASLLYENLNDSAESETVVIQGIADCAFLENGRLVVVDYKTDLVKSGEELAERYSTQLALYSYALEKCTGLPVSETLLYSFALNKTVTVEKRYVR